MMKAEKTVSDNDGKTSFQVAAGRKKKRRAIESLKITKNKQGDCKKLYTLMSGEINRETSLRSVKKQVGTVSVPKRERTERCGRRKRNGNSGTFSQQKGGKS